MVKILEIVEAEAVEMNSTVLLRATETNIGSVEQRGEARWSRRLAKVRGKKATDVRVTRQQSA